MSPSLPEPPAQSGHMPSWARNGRRVGRYALGPLLGRGGMGEVFEAWDLVLARPVALKLLTVGSAAATVRFMQEARLQARVDHPNVCRVLDADVEADLPFIAMQLVRGPYVKAAGLSLREVADLMQKVAGAIHAAHRLGLVHRDLKPSNILIERNEVGGWTPFVCDFGLAKDMGAEALTQTFCPMGTPAYMAPEQMHPDSAALGPHSDVYGLGATLCDLLLGRPPALPSPRAPWAVTLAGPTDPSLPLGGDELPKAMQGILRRCLAWSWDERYPTAAALAEDLRRFLDGESLQPMKPGLRKSMIRWARRRPLLLIGAGILAAGGLGSGISLEVGRRNSVQQAEAAARFAAVIKELQYDMRVERMMPPHDLRPAFSRVRARMEEIRQGMAHGGRSSQGPGHFALGWGHLLLRSPQEALGAFKAAWDQGYRTSEVATALVRASCEAYSDELPMARQEGEAALAQLAKSYLAPAQTWLAAIGPDRPEQKALVEGHLELLRRNPDKALALAARIIAQSPSTYEAWVLEGSAHGQQGFAHQLKGDYAAARSHYALADRALHHAQSMARSDEGALKAQLNRRLAWLAVQEDAGERPGQTYAEIDALADRLLLLNPDWLPAIADKLTVLWRRGDFELRKGKDPSSTLEQGMAILARAETLPGSGLRLHRDRANLQRVMAEVQFWKGNDPTACLDAAMRSGREDEFTADLRWVIARWQRVRGIDPVPQLDQALKNLERPSFQNRDEYGWAGRHAQTWRIRAYWALEQGGNPDQAVSKCLEFAEMALKANPRSAEARLDSAYGNLLVFYMARKKQRLDPRPLRKAVAEAQEACRNRPPWAAALACLAEGLLCLLEADLEPDPPKGLATIRSHLGQLERLRPGHPEDRHLWARLGKLERIRPALRPGRA